MGCKSVVLGMTALLIFGTSGVCFSQSSGKGVPAENSKKIEWCKAAELAIEEALKEVASAAESGMFDNNAPRQSNRKLAESVEVLKIQNQLTYMQMLGCTAPQQPIDYTAYSAVAIGCAIAPVANKEAACNKEAWARGRANPVMRTPKTIQ